jgi:hypothetical protein
VRGATPIDETHLPDKTWMHSTSYRWASSWSPAEEFKENKSKKWLRIDDLNLLFFVIIDKMDSVARRMAVSETASFSTTKRPFKCRFYNNNNSGNSQTVCGLASNNSILHTSARTTDMKDPAPRPPAGHPVSLESTTSPNLKGLSTTTWILQQALDRTDPSPPTTRS